MESKIWLQLSCQEDSEVEGTVPIRTLYMEIATELENQLERKLLKEGMQPFLCETLLYNNNKTIIKKL